MTDDRYRILIVLTPPFVPTAGGVQMSTNKMARWFVSAGHKVKIYSFGTSGHEKPAWADFSHAAAEGGSASKENRKCLVQAIAAFAPDIVINQMPYEHEIGEVLKDYKTFVLLGCLRNTLYAVRGDLSGYVRRTAPRVIRPLAEVRLVQWLFLQLHRRRHRADLKRILETYDQFVMFGPPNLEELAYFVPRYDRNRIRLIPNSIPEVADVPPPKEKRILWLGRMEYAQKRAELIPEVWQRICTELPDWNLDVVGDGPALKDLKRRALDIGLPRIHFHGQQTPDKYFRRSPIFMMTSAFEGFPNTLVEAQSHASIPVIFDSYPVASWIVEDGRDGFLINPYDTDAMASRIIALANHPERQRFAERALENARRFQVDYVGAKWQALFDAEVPKHTESHETKSSVA